MDQILDQILAVVCDALMLCDALRGVFILFLGAFPVFPFRTFPSWEEGIVPIWSGTVSIKNNKLL